MAVALFPHLPHGPIIAAALIALGLALVAWGAVAAVARPRTASVPGRRYG